MATAKHQSSELKERIAQVDRKLVEELEARFELSKQLHSLREGEAASPDGAEAEVLQAVERLASGAAPRESLRAIFSQIIAEARGVERPTRVAYVGPEGNFCYQTVRAEFGSSSMLIECPAVAEALEQVRRERALYCVFPFDSSVEGLNLPAISALAQTDLVLVAERTVPAVLCLMSRSGGPADIKTIYGTPAAHAACDRFIQREFAKVAVLDVRSPIEAAEQAFGAEGAAAIVPEATGRHAGLQVQKENVGDEPGLKYRFGVVGTRPASRTGHDTTCLLFSLEDVPGTLHQVLSHFAERGLNLKKIQSRPVRAATWDYIFYVEVSGHATDRAMVTALEAMKRSTRYLKLLGSFPTEA